ncbi:MAG: hypothetical protein GY861_19495 [bacterium]|nr:hypothetical protein [bacterium]
MAEVSTFRAALDFFGDIGIFDVVLPFLLVFTIVFAILEKTKIFGMEKIGEEEYTKKSLNSMAAFVIAFFVIASSQLVQFITKVSANMIVLLLASVFFLLLVGSFHQEKKEGFFLSGNTKNLFVGIMFVGLLFIFLNAIETGGQTWLEWILDWIGQFWSNGAVASVILILVVVGFMFYIVREPKKNKKEDGG